MSTSRLSSQVTTLASLKAGSEAAPVASTQRVVGEIGPVAEAHGPPGGVDALDWRVYEGRTDRACRLLERGAAGAPERERLGDGKRAVDEVRGGGDEGQLDALAAESAEREERLEAGDAAAGDDNVMWGGGHVRQGHALGTTEHRGDADDCLRATTDAFRSRRTSSGRRSAGAEGSEAGGPPARASRARG